jgi:hypothetical protein
MLEPMKVPRCDAFTLMRHDRWGGIEMHCELAPDHGGFHSHAMTACEPRAELTWFSEPDLSGSEES